MCFAPFKNYAAEKFRDLLTRLRDINFVVTQSGRGNLWGNKSELLKFLLMINAQCQ